tara:strand:- start:70337 stop:71611 length:1275 start_codon:yes stop_codon:yes gene_type:complete
MITTDIPTNLSFSEMSERTESPVIIDLMTRALTIPNLLSLAAGFTSNEILPVEQVTQALETIKAEAANKEYLQYGTNQGRPKLRKAILDIIAAHPGEQPESWDPNHLVISNGSQQTLYIAMQALCNPGDIIFVEEPSYFVYLELLRGLGIQAISIPTLGHNQIDFEAFDALIQELDYKGQADRIKATYLVSYFSNPSSGCLSAEDKAQLGVLFKKHKLPTAIIEDAAYRDLYYEAPHPAPSILSVPELEGIACLYLGTFTKPFSCGMKTGFGYCTDAQWLQNILNIKGHHDFGSSNFNQALIEAVLLDGQYEPHLKTQRAFYAKKAALLQKTFTDEGLVNLGWHWDTPKGGLFLWLIAPEHIDLSIGSDFYEACLQNGVLYVPGDLCIAERSPKNCTRISFGTLNDEGLIEAGKRFVKVAKQFS